jgi:hypothetical protein
MLDPTVSLFSSFFANQRSNLLFLSEGPPAHLGENLVSVSGDPKFAKVRHKRFFKFAKSSIRQPQSVRTNPGKVPSDPQNTILTGKSPSCPAWSLPRSKKRQQCEQLSNRLSEKQNSELMSV